MMISHPIEHINENSPNLRLVSSRGSSDNMFDSVLSRDHSMVSTAATSVVMTPNGSFENNQSVIGKATAHDDGNVFAKSLSISLQPKTIVILVGLPASGKSTICKQLVTYLNKHGCYGRIYNTGEVRRMEHRRSNSFDDSNYFDPSNEDAKAQREQFAKMALDSILHDLKDNRITRGFLDATNTTRQRRELLMSIIRNNTITKVDNVIIFDVQSGDPNIINFNINGKASNSDYWDKDYEYSIRDFKKRTDHYHKAYIPVSQDELDQYKGVVGEYIMIKNAGSEHKFVDFNDRDDSTDSLIKYFVKNYKYEQGKHYMDAVNRFMESIKK